MVPVINQTTSVLFWDRGRFHAFAPSLAPGSPAATSWAIKSGGLPEGMSLNTQTGRVSGIPTKEAEGSVFNVAIVARNAAGESQPLPLVIGVYWAEAELDGTVEALVDLDHGGVKFARQSYVDEDGRTVINWKYRDRFPLSVVYVKGSEVVDLPISSIAVTATKGVDERKIRLDSGTVVRLGENDLARFQTVIDLASDSLRPLISSEERVTLKVEIESKWVFDNGGPAPELATRTSIDFVLNLIQDYKP